ncbi:MAG: ABC transporter ATP-binding protein [Deltaproteobacteria bacterium]|nr:ABC transporter ATP-binding protein [Deltaproteobacteria bacterium]
MGAHAIECSGLGKRYRVYQVSSLGGSHRNRLGQALASPFSWLTHLLREPDPDQVLWALRDFDLEVPAGQAVGIIGRNGSGKSTLLKLLARVTEPTEGRAVVRGRVGSLLEVGTGFNPELTGRENLYLYGAILGMHRAEIVAKQTAILEFAGLGGYVDTPLKRYSSGMRIRLGFAVAAHLEPEILLMDEVLAVGDTAFQKQCVDKMAAAARGGATVLFVSHHMEVILGFCTRVVWLDQGRIKAQGPAEEVVRTYLAAMSQTPETWQDLGARNDRTGNGKLTFTAFALMDEAGRPAPSLALGDMAVFALDYEAPGPLQQVDLALEVKDHLGRQVTSWSTQLTGQVLENLPARGRVLCQVPRLPLAPGRYYLGASARVGLELADHLPQAVSFEVNPGDFYHSGSRLNGQGQVYLDHSWRVE